MDSRLNVNLALLIELITKLTTVKSLKAGIWVLALCQRWKFLQSLWKRLQTPAFFHLPTQLIMLNYPVILSHWHSTTVSLRTYPFTQIKRSVFLPRLGHCVMFLNKTLFSHATSLRPKILLDITKLSGKLDKILVATRWWLAYLQAYLSPILPSVSPRREDTATCRLWDELDSSP